MELLIKFFGLKILMHIAEILSGKVIPSYIPTNNLWHCSCPFNLTKLLIVNFHDFFPSKGFIAELVRSRTHGLFHQLGSLLE